MGLEPTCAYLRRSSSGLEAVSHYGNIQQVGHFGVEPKTCWSQTNRATKCTCARNTIIKHKYYVAVFLIVIIVTVVFVIVAGVIVNKTPPLHCYSIVHLEDGVRAICTKRAENPDAALAVFHEDHPDAQVIMVTRSWNKARAKTDEG